MLGSLVLALLSTVSAAATPLRATPAERHLLRRCPTRLGGGRPGAIWHTNDGRQWQPQASGVGCPLWAVASSTRDRLGGRRIFHTRTPTRARAYCDDARRRPDLDVAAQTRLPALRRLGFFDPLHGWAVGCLRPCIRRGVRQRRRRPELAAAAGRGGRAWLAADFVTPRTRRAGRP